jgi:alpha-galactosidase
MAKIDASTRIATHSFEKHAACAKGLRLFRRARRRHSWQHGSNTPRSEMNAANATAVRLLHATDPEGFPLHSAWETAPPICFNADWQGYRTDPTRETEVRLLWTPETLFLKFRARFREITVFPDAEPSGRRDHLWDRDVAEVFLQPDSSDPLRYKELEVSPNGMWIDLDLSHGQRSDLQSGLRRRVHLNDDTRTWIAELAIPMKSLTPSFDPTAIWRANFFRVEGPAEPRFYSAWQPTRTPEPNFHIPEAFGKLIFVE